MSAVLPRCLLEPGEHVLRDGGPVARLVGDTECERVPQPSAHRVPLRGDRRVYRLTFRLGRPGCVSTTLSVTGATAGRSGRDRRRAHQECTSRRRHRCLGYPKAK
ncbi:hypothetical protein BN903_171 [Halorubrum sp. AJ67]|nr:hypothetical protein BN903_171 [Halorubrum sp. AJ67]